MAESVFHNEGRLCLVLPDRCIEFQIDGASPISLFESDLEVLESTTAISSVDIRQSGHSKTQTLSALAKVPPKSIVGPSKEQIFSPPREYYIPRDVKSALGLLAGIVIVGFGIYGVMETRGLDFYVWIMVFVGVSILVATILDLSFFPPWR